MYPESNYQLPNVSDAGEVYWKEFTGFFSPYDVRGTAFIVARYDDPRRGDDGWAYVPSLRRVRRISAEVKSDSLMGNRAYPGRLLRLLRPPAGVELELPGLERHDCGPYQDQGGTTTGCATAVPTAGSTTTLWQIRRMAIVERTPKDPRHPYSSAIQVIDAETWETWLHIAFDRKGKLWKVWQWGYAWSDDAKRYTDMNHGRSAVHWKNVDTVDIQNGRGKPVARVRRRSARLLVDFISRLYDLNRLTELHR